MKKKVLIICACLVAVLAIAIGATLAYLTDDATVLNTFTVGDVSLKLEETKTDETGAPVDPAARTEEGNEYLLVPGHKYTKDPTATVEKASEDCYVRALVQVVDLDALEAVIPVATYPEYYQGDVFLLEKLVGGWDSTAWAIVGVDDDTYEFRYIGTKATNGIVPKNENADTELEPLFTDFTVPGFLVNEDIASLSGLQISVTAEAIQADTFADADAAWDAFDA